MRLIQVTKLLIINNKMYKKCSQLRQIKMIKQKCKVNLIEIIKEVNNLFIGPKMQHLINKI